MERNPFIDFISVIDSRNKELSQVPFFIGKVTSGLPNLEVQVEGLVLDKQSLLVDKGIIDRNNATISCSAGSVTHNLKDVLKAGDKVILLRINDTFVVISKVVSI